MNAAFAYTRATAVVRDVNEARSGWGRCRGRGQNCIIFSAKFYILIPFSKNEIFGRFSTELHKFWFKTGFNMGTLLLSTLKRPATPLDAGYCFCVYTLKRKCHILSADVTKHFNSTSKTTRPRGQAIRGGGQGQFFGPRGRGRDEDLTSLAVVEILLCLCT